MVTPAATTSQHAWGQSVAVRRCWAGRRPNTQALHALFINIWQVHGFVVAWKRQSSGETTAVPCSHYTLQLAYQERHGADKTLPSAAHSTERYLSIAFTAAHRLLCYTPAHRLLCYAYLHLSLHSSSGSCRCCCCDFAGPWRARSPQYQADG